ncbi:protease inhibitor I42 family protein [Chloroflexota bacterium]
MKQVDHRYIAPETGVPGGSGKEVWTFQGIKMGLSGVTMEYIRPWEVGENNEWTFNITINVR